MQWSKRQIFASFAQIVVGVTFVFSGMMKGIDPTGTAIKIEEYLSITGIHLPSQIYLGASITLNVIEALLGISLLIGWRRWITRWVALILMSVMTLLTLYIYIFEPVADCGCFGDALVISNAATYWKNVVLLLLTIFLFRNQFAWYNWTTPINADIIGAVAFVSFLHFNVMNVKNEPVIDFRPYTIGSDLMELTTTGGTEGEYEYRFVYSKDGAEHTFSMDELSQVDSTWVFVRDEVEVIKEAVRPLGADFVLVREDGSNAVESLSYDHGQSIIVISDDLNEVKPSRLEKIVKSCDEPLLLAMGNTGEIWKKPEYERLREEFAEVLFLDKTTAKTVVRNNPGVLIIKNGKIANKMTGNQFVDKLANPKFRKDPYQLPSVKSRRIDLVYAFSGIIVLFIVILVSRFYKKK